MLACWPGGPLELKHLQGLGENDGSFLGLGSCLVKRAVKHRACCWHLITGTRMLDGRGDGGPFLEL